MSKPSKSIEVEIQVQISNSKELLEFLSKEANFVGESQQIDTYFSPTDKDFTKERPVEEWLRLRDSSGKYSLNYKKWHYEKDGRSHYCDEYEIKIDDLDKADKILTALDMKPVVVVDKTRKVWNYKDYEIAVDYVKGLGDFIEIEYKGNEDNLYPEKITKSMIDFLKQFNVGEISKNYVGYPFQLLFPDEVTYERI